MCGGSSMHVAEVKCIDAGCRWMELVPRNQLASGRQVEGAADWFAGWMQPDRQAVGRAGRQQFVATATRHANNERCAALRCAALHCATLCCTALTVAQLHQGAQRVLALGPLAAGGAGGAHLQRARSDQALLQAQQTPAKLRHPGAAVCRAAHGRASHPRHGQQACGQERSRRAGHTQLKEHKHSTHRMESMHSTQRACTAEQLASWLASGVAQMHGTRNMHSTQRACTAALASWSASGVAQMASTSSFTPYVFQLQT